jgi:hypothetical protein
LKAPREADWLDAKYLAKFLHFNTSKGQRLEVDRSKPFGESKLVSNASWEDGEEDYRRCSGRRLKVIHILRWMSIEINVKVEAIVANDSSAALANAGKLGPGRMRHEETQALFLKGLVRDGTVSLQKNTSQDNTQDLHMKLPAAQFLEFSKMIGVSTCDENKFTKLPMKRVNVIANI